MFELDAKAACSSSDSSLFFAVQVELIHQAQEICQVCELRTACLRGALERREFAGVWGGELFEDGEVVVHKRPRGRPRRDSPVAYVSLSSMAQASLAEVGQTDDIVGAA